MSAHAIATRSAVVLAGVLLAAACTSESVSPAASEAATGSGGEAGAPPAPKAPRRRMEIRNPLGGPADNLLVDGDFELSASPYATQLQTGVMAFGAQSRVDIAYETGGICRSGLRCAVLRPAVSLYLQGASAKAQAMVATFMARVPPGQPCSRVTGVLFDCNTGLNKAGLYPVDDAPTRDGWCSYDGVLNEQKSATCMWITNHLAADETGLVDAATLLPQAGTTSLALRPSPLTKAEQAEVEAAVEWLRKRRGITAPEKPARDAR